jgi:hypothetical protein
MLSNNYNWELRPLERDRSVYIVVVGALFKSMLLIMYRQVGMGMQTNVDSIKLLTSMGISQYPLR